ncbi:unnamed protein product [Heligmosomoides polygyrus]|uniref:Uncharacterized protein n=1 Tax=Heligmosomoides polygyrus TaxID=6339 RepID=A0A183FJD2_HELPZ|nr:unnamed protein product [Heligmosomoides polygyrus]
MLQDYITEKAARFRHKREVRYVQDSENKQSRYEWVPSQPPLIQALFCAQSLSDIPDFETRPIVDQRLLALILRWNITNDDLKRSKFYAPEYPLLSTLRTIRYGEYRFRQLARLRYIQARRPRNYAETTIQRDMTEGVM